MRATYIILSLLLTTSMSVLAMDQFVNDPVTPLLIYDHNQTGQHVTAQNSPEDSGMESPQPSKMLHNELKSTISPVENEQLRQHRCITSATQFRVFIEARNLSNITVLFLSDHNEWTLSPETSKVNNGLYCYNQCGGLKYQYYKQSGQLLCEGITPGFTKERPCNSIIFSGSKCSANVCTRIAFSEEGGDD